MRTAREIPHMTDELRVGNPNGFLENATGPCKIRLQSAISIGFAWLVCHLAPVGRLESQATFRRFCCSY